MEGDSKGAIKRVDDALAGEGGEDGMPMVSSLAELSKTKSRLMREDEALLEELEEEKELEEQANNIKQHFIDIKTGQQYDPDKRFGVIEDGTQLVYDNITTSYDLNLPPDYYLKYVQDNMPARDEKNSKPWFIRPHHIESLTNHFNSLKDDVLNTRYFSNYNREKEEELTNNEKAIDYIENHLEQLRMKQNAMTLAKTGGQKDFEQLIEEMQKKTSVEAYKGFQTFIKDKNPRPSPKILCIEAYESILTDQRVKERAHLNKVRFDEYNTRRPPAAKWYELKTKEFSKELERNRYELKPNNSNQVYLDILQDPYLY